MHGSGTSQADEGAGVAAAVVVLLRACAAIGLATKGSFRMMFRKVASIGLAAMLLTGGICVAGNWALPAAASSRTDAKAEQKAADLAGKTRKALAKGQWDKAIGTAEAAVALSGEDASYRFLLGTSYLRSGRFASAEQALSDAMTLRPDGTIAINLALAQIATGGWAKARATLERHAADIPAADRGLALALAGDPAGAVDVLAQAVRSGGADAKTRQNLALAYALAGKWVEARTLAGVDLAPVDADRRIIEWASFARPGAAPDQVATLLGVRPVADPGQPVAIALAATAPPVASVDLPTSTVDVFMPGRAEEPIEAAALDAKPAPTPAPVQPVATPVAALPDPAPTVVGAPTARKAVSAAAATASARGKWTVQIGTYGNATAARRGWFRALRRMPQLRRHVPTGRTVVTRGDSFYRLGVAGFSRTGAAALCRGYRINGGNCFVRRSAGEQIAAWAKRERVQFAAR